MSQPGVVKLPVMATVAVNKLVEQALDKARRLGAPQHVAELAAEFVSKEKEKDLAAERKDPDPDPDPSFLCVQLAVHRERMHRDNIVSALKLSFAATPDEKMTL